MSLQTHVTAIIPAAGLSSRMKRFKPLLPLGSHTILENTIALFHTCGIEDILVITGHRAEELTPVIHCSGATPVYNKDYQGGMFSTVLTGIRHLKPSCDAFFLIPADIPLVRPHTVRKILECHKSSQAKIIYPVYEEMRGHPPLISSDLIPDILNYQNDGGMRACLKEFDKEALDIQVCDGGIHQDADTPEDYSHILRRLDNADLPTTQECLCLLTHVRKLDEAIVRHCKKTSETAVLLARSLKKDQTNINLDLVKIAALLHDMARDNRNHAYCGSEILKEMGYEQLADIIGDHMDIQVNPETAITEKEIVYFADKLTVHDRLETNFQKRFDEKLNVYKDSNTTVKAIENRLESAQIICNKIEDSAEKTLSEIFSSERV